MNKNDLLTIDKCDKILRNSLAYAENQYAGDDIDKGYLSGAMHEATAAVPLLTALHFIKKELTGFNDVTINNVLLSIDNAINEYNNAE